MNHSLTPYSHLSPKLILDAIEDTGFHPTGHLFALNSYENRVYQIGVEDLGYIIAKFYRPNRWSDSAILEEHQFSKECAELEIPVIPPLEINHKTLHEYETFRFALFQRESGHALEINNLVELEWMGRFLGRFHAAGQCRDFLYRSHLTVSNQGEGSYHYLLENDFIPASLKSKFCQVTQTLLKKIEQIFLEIDPKYLRCHGDCHVGNILWNSNGPKIVDLDDCLMGPAIQDIWMLLSGDESQAQLQLETILSGYREFNDFNFREIILIEPLRALRLLNYSAWLAKRWDDPAFPPNFTFFNTEHYWHQLIQQMEEQMIKIEDKSLFSF